MILASPPAPVASDTPLPPLEGCPLCGVVLRPEQDWCLSCGGAARTRLAAAPGWRAPLIGLGLVILLALGALTVALVELAGAPPSSTPVTRTVTTPAAATATTTVPTTTVPTTAVPTTSVPTTTAPTGTAPLGTTPNTTTTATATTGTVPPTPLPGANVPGTLGSSAPKR